ncbi:MAG: 6-carboxytetrahydropterin synthase [Gemmatimonadetes bacterium]|nr:6-carboxytetrahydropterin synthase [Gemmatimonadota bacterium]
MSKASLTRAVEFPAGHRYHRPDWDAARNETAFGKCSGAPGHGHNYRVEVTVRGEIDPETGMVVDLTVLDRLLRELVREPFDHAFLNDQPEFAGGVIPTTENLARVVWGRVSPALPDACSLLRVRVLEDRNLWADYDGSGS